MSDPRMRWDEVAADLEELGLKLKLHLEQASTESDHADEATVEEALHTLGDGVRQVFGALSNATKDDAVRADVKEVGQSVVEALDATFAVLGDRFRSAVKGR